MVTEAVRAEIGKDGRSETGGARIQGVLFMRVNRAQKELSDNHGTKKFAKL